MLFRETSSGEYINPSSLFSRLRVGFFLRAFIYSQCEVLKAKLKQHKIGLPRNKEELVKALRKVRRLATRGQTVDNFTAPMLN